MISTGIVKTKLFFWIRPDTVDQWYAEKNVFFILGLGRSGTHFLSQLLNADSNAVVYHEPLPEDFQAVPAAQQSDQAGYHYIEHVRKKRIYLLTRKRAVLTYGEANSNLRYHVKALQQSIPNAKLLHLIRDGRDVVRSLMARQHYTNDGIGHHSIIPRLDDPYYLKWSGLSRFEKMCWLWADSNTRLSNDVKEYVRFEQIVSDYDYFHEKIERYLGIDIGRARWQAAIEQPADPTVAHVLPSWRQWDVKLQQSFDTICGPVMQQYSYTKDSILSPL